MWSWRWWMMMNDDEWWWETLAWNSKHKLNLRIQISISRKHNGIYSKYKCTNIDSLFKFVLLLCTIILFRIIWILCITIIWRVCVRLVIFIQGCRLWLLLIEWNGFVPFKEMQFLEELDLFNACKYLSRPDPRTTAFASSAVSPSCFISKEAAINPVLPLPSQQWIQTFLLHSESK